jgi:hypothetical protein
MSEADDRSDKPNNKEPKYPFERLTEAVAAALQPTLSVLRELVVELKVANGRIRESRDKTFDMETAIKARQGWTCGTDHCTKCDIHQRLYCLRENGLLTDARVDDLSRYLHEGGRPK